jgi:hypothetical protein
MVLLKKNEKKCDKTLDIITKFCDSIIMKEKDPILEKIRQQNQAMNNALAELGLNNKKLEKSSIRLNKAVKEFQKGK